MKVLFQPANLEGSPGDWQETDAPSWPALGDFHVNALNVQGVVFEGYDHYGVRKRGSALQVAGWCDDPDDWPAGRRWAREIWFEPLAADPRPEYGGAINTVQRTVLYAEADIRSELEEAYAGVYRVTVEPYRNFDPRLPAKDGVWLSDASYEAHQQVRETRGWREWTEHLDSSELDENGRLKDQRAQGRYRIPDGTRTYYHNPEAGPVVGSPTNENSLGLAPTVATAEQSGNVSQNGAVCYEATTPSGEPNTAQWPTTGVYRCQLDVTAAGGDLTFGLLTQGLGNQGGFLRVNSGVTLELQRVQQAEAAFAGTGLHLATATNPLWLLGVATNRYAIRVAAIRVVGHGHQVFTLQLGEADDFTDGPWPAAAGAADDSPGFFGANF